LQGRRPIERGPSYHCRKCELENLQNKLKKKKNEKLLFTLKKQKKKTKTGALSIRANTVNPVTLALNLRAMRKSMALQRVKIPFLLTKIKLPARMKNFPSI